MFGKKKKKDKPYDKTSEYDDRSMLRSSYLGALYFTVRGNFKLMGVCAVCSAVVFSMLVVLFKERRVSRIMNEDNYDQEQKPM